MNMTGIVRRIDDLGRIVIPKEIRKTLRIKEGDPIEINISDENIILKKYSSVEEIGEIFSIFIEKISNIIQKNVVICDRDKVICGSYNIGEKYINKNISNNIYNMLEDRKKDFVNNTSIEIVENETFDGNFIFSSIVVNGDVVGGVLIFSNTAINDVDRMFLNLIIDIFVKYIEE